MAKIFEFNRKRNGSLIDSVSGVAGTLTAGSGGFKQTEKGTAILFDASVTKLDTNLSSSNLSLTGDITIEAWIKNNGWGELGGANGYIISNGKCIWYSTIDGARIRGTSNGVTLAFSTVNSIKLGLYYHLVITRTSAGITNIYINNELSGTADQSSGTPEVGNTDLIIGNNDASSATFNGPIAKVSIYNSILTGQERNKLYEEFLQAQPILKPKRNFINYKPTDLSNLKGTGPTQGLVAAYNFIPNGSTLVDISGNGNKGTCYDTVTSKEGLLFNGVSSYVAVTSTNGLIGNLSFCCRVYIKNGEVTSRILDNSKLGLAFDSAPHTKLQLTRDGSTVIYSAAGSIVPNNWYNIVVTSTSTGASTFYINGVVSGTENQAAGTPVSSTSWFIGDTSTHIRHLNCILEDFKIYDRILTLQEIRDYHNSFVKPELIETFADEGADGTAKLPREWASGTGVYKVNENSISTNNKFTATTSNNVALYMVGSQWLYTGASTNSLIFNTGVLTVGKRYAFTYRIVANPNLTKLQLYYPETGVQADITNTVGTYTINTTSVASTSFNLRVSGNEPAGLIFDSVSVVEIPPLPTIVNGTKYLECTTAGTIAIPSKSAYGEWEFDVYKGADANEPDALIISDRTSGTAYNGYSSQINSNESVRFRRVTAGSQSSIMATANAYLANNTWYRLKISRLKSEGVFKDIPTLQTSNLMNSSTVPYPIFTSNGRYGFRAAGTGTFIAGTADEISFTNGAKYLVEFDSVINTGTPPKIRLRNSIDAGDVSDIKDTVSGRNSIILTAMSTDTGVLIFRNDVSTADYEISGLTIRRIYDANTFAVFIKGGAFGDNYTLVSTAGGSGTNPIVDASYTTSNYFVTDLDAGDRIANIKLSNGIKQ